MNDQDLLDLFVGWRADVDSVPFAHEHLWEWKPAAVQAVAVRLDRAPQIGGKS